MLMIFQFQIKVVKIMCKNFNFTASHNIPGVTAHWRPGIINLFLPHTQLSEDRGQISTQFWMIFFFIISNNNTTVCVNQFMVRHAAFLWFEVLSVSFQFEIRVINLYLCLCIYQYNVSVNQSILKEQELLNLS